MDNKRRGVFSIIYRLATWIFGGVVIMSGVFGSSGSIVSTLVIVAVGALIMGAAGAPIAKRMLGHDSVDSVSYLLGIVIGTVVTPFIVIYDIAMLVKDAKARKIEERIEIAKFINTITENDTEGGNELETDECDDVAQGDIVSELETDKCDDVAQGDIDSKLETDKCDDVAQGGIVSELKSDLACGVGEQGDIVSELETDECDDVEQEDSDLEMI